MLGLFRFGEARAPDRLLVNRLHQERNWSKFFRIAGGAPAHWPSF